MNKTTEETQKLNFLQLLMFSNRFVLIFVSNFQIFQKISSKKTFKPFRLLRKRPLNLLWGPLELVKPRKLAKA